jgi:hypothetical protein
MTDLEIFQSIAKGYNNLDYRYFEQVLSPGVIYESQWVLSSLIGYDAVIGYLKRKFEAVRESKDYVYAEIGIVDPDRRNSRTQDGLLLLDDEYGIIISQGKRENKGSVICLKIKNNKVDRIDMCFIPHWSFFIRTGEYPS